MFYFICIIAIIIYNIWFLRLIYSLMMDNENEYKKSNRDLLEMMYYDDEYEI
jgi:hypothetical protein